MEKRYTREGKCIRCGWCCLHEDCDYLEIDGELATCLIFGDPVRPNKCVWFPQAPPILNEKCGFYFLDTWDNNRKVKFGWEL